MVWSGRQNFEQRANLKFGRLRFYAHSASFLLPEDGLVQGLEDLLADAKQMLGEGVRELVLTEVNLGTYQSEGRVLWK